MFSKNAKPCAFGHRFPVRAVSRWSVSSHTLPAAQYLRRKPNAPTACSVCSGVGTRGAGPELCFRPDAGNTRDAQHRGCRETIRRYAALKGWGSIRGRDYLSLPLISIFGYFLSNQKVTSAPSCSRTNNLNSHGSLVTFCQNRK